MVSRLAETGSRDLAVMSEASATPLPLVERTAQGLTARGLATRDGDTLTVTPAGTTEADRLLDAQRSVIHELIDGWPGEHEPDVENLIDDIARRLSEEPDQVVLPS